MSHALLSPINHIGAGRWFPSDGGTLDSQASHLQSAETASELRLHKEAQTTLQVLSGWQAAESISLQYPASRRKHFNPVPSKPLTGQSDSYVAAKRQKHDRISVTITSRSFAAKLGAIASLNANTARGQWLEDTHIDHVQALLSTSHPAVDGHSHRSCPSLTKHLPPSSRWAAACSHHVHLRQVVASASAHPTVHLSRF